MIEQLTTHSQKEELSRKPRLSIISLVSEKDLADQNLALLEAEIKEFNEKTVGQVEVGQYSEFLMKYKQKIKEFYIRVKDVQVDIKSAKDMLTSSFLSTLKENLGNLGILFKANKGKANDKWPSSELLKAPYSSKDQLVGVQGDNSESQTGIERSEEPKQDDTISKGYGQTDYET